MVKSGSSMHENNATLIYAINAMKGTVESSSNNTAIQNSTVPLLLMRFSVSTRIAKNQDDTYTICAIFVLNWTECIDAFSLLFQSYARKRNDAKNRAILSLRAGSLVWMGSRNRELIRLTSFVGSRYPNKWACSQAKQFSDFSL